MVRRIRQSESIPAKANKILNILLLIFGVMTLRIWHLCVVQHEDRVALARRPRERVLLEPSERASITDRFGIPLAHNRVGYEATIIYSQIKEIPSVRWVSDNDGKRMRTQPRREHISGLSNLLAEELDLDNRRVEDLIHSKAALYSQRPFVIASDLTETQYYRLRMLEREWPGLHARRIPRRHYPLGRVASHIIGYMGAMNREEYEAIIGELHNLETYLARWEAGDNPSLPEGMANSRQARERLLELKQRAYGLTDWLGKAGVEGKFEEQLRGYQGRRLYYADARGNYLRELAGGQTPLPGQRLTLTISAELQALAENLLIASERLRDGRSSSRNRITGSRTPLRQPWVKGGAIVVIDPNNGEVLALASYPRFDPNDFVQQNANSQIRRWLESKSYIAHIWDGAEPNQREALQGGKEVDELRWLDWQTYLSSILPESHPVVEELQARPTIADAIQLQNLLTEAERELDDPSFDLYDIVNVLFPEPEHEGHRAQEPYGALEDFATRLAAGEAEVISLRSQLEPFFTDLRHNYDKVLLADLYKLAVDPEHFSGELLRNVGQMHLAEYRQLTWSYFTVEASLKEMLRSLFHEVDWDAWRREEGRAWLRERREQEKKEGCYARPYLDLYDRKERQLFDVFWREQRWALLTTFLLGEETASEPGLEPYTEFCRLWQRELASGAHSALPWVASYHQLTEALQRHPPSALQPLLASMRRFDDLTRPLWGRYRPLRQNADGVWTEQELAAAFYPRYGYGAMRSLAYRQRCTQGSIFKLVVAYEALRQRYRQGIEPLDPFVMTDKLFRGANGWNVGLWSDGEPIPRLYRGGTLPRSYRDLGKMGIVEAISHSANPYFAILAGDYIEKPSDLVEAARRFSYGGRTGIDLPGEIPGSLPNDLDHNRTGLYSLSMGQHTLINTPIQTAVMLSALANGGTIYKPQILRVAAGPDLVDDEEEVLHRERYCFQEALLGVGLEFPLFTAAEDRRLARQVQEASAIPLRRVDLSDKVQRYLLEGMRLAAEGNRSGGGAGLSWIYRNHPNLIRRWLQVGGDLIGKSSTSEQVEVVDLDRERGTNIYNHTWFGGIAFPEGAESYLSTDPIGKPELVVVIHLPYGGYGKEASPIAGEIVRAWREIKTSKDG